MMVRGRSATALFVLLVGSTGLVQAGVEKAPRPAPPAAGPQAPKLAAVTPSETPSRLPRRTEIVEYGSWTVTCRDGSGLPGRTCSAETQIAKSDTRQVMFVWSLSRAPGGALTTTLLTPTGVQVGPGVELRPGKAGGRVVPFVSCEPTRCTASAAIDDKLLKDVAASADTRAYVTATSGTAIEFQVSLDGFDKAIEALR